MNILAKNLLILASAGSGKTFQLGNRVIGKVAIEKIDPNRIVALTFTRKAAGEFADSVLTKLADGVLDERKAAEICEDLNADISVPEVLEKIVEALPRLQLTTLDSFFSRVVRGFQYELGLSGGVFELLTGERLKNAEAEILQDVLRDGFDKREEFYHAFRKASMGRGEQGVQRAIEEFVQNWHRLWKEGIDREAFGNPAIFSGLPEVGDWCSQKDELLSKLRDAESSRGWTAMLRSFEEHSVGSSLKLNTLGNRLLESIHETGAVSVKDGRKEITLPEETWTSWKELYQLAVSCEISAAVTKTKAVGELIEEIDREHAHQLRRRGLLSFDDVKILLGRWSQSEDARLRRELVDYRLDGRYDHWLLDEFQDTSVAEWLALEPLIDEAVGDPDGSFFVVGDRKQGIYAWRGGDVSLFDKVENRYGGGLEIESMDTSWRSCPPVLNLVNAVCGNLNVIQRIFGKNVRERWHWKDHVSARPEVEGEAKVEIAPQDEHADLLIAELNRLGIGKKDLTCGVLLRTGALVEKYTELLRSAGFDVIEAGERNPGTDHAVGVVINHFIKWLANPADQYSREVLEMSPLGSLLNEWGDQWGRRWERISSEIQAIGYARFVSGLVAPEWGRLGLYGRRRAEDLIGALAEFDASGEACPRAAANWIHELKVSQAPGVAAIQVMTIHKSKGLGFDVVMLPEVPDSSQVPNSTHFKVASGSNWLLQLPGKWAYSGFPETREAFDRWKDTQRYEALCLLYVALTRAKRGLYVYLGEEPKSRRDPDLFETPGNLVRQSAGLEIIDSNPDWMDSVDEHEKKPGDVSRELPQATFQRSRISPSSHGPHGASESGGGRLFGLEVHRLFEKISWLKEDEIPKQPYSGPGKLVEDILKIAEIHRVFRRKGWELYREQPFELIVDGKWMSGVVDRLQVERENGVVNSMEVIDFKTERVSSAEELVGRHGEQMSSYRLAMSEIFGVEVSSVRCLIVSTCLGEVIDVEGISVQREFDL